MIDQEIEMLNKTCFGKYKKAELITIIGHLIKIIKILHGENKRWLDWAKMLSKKY